VSDISEGSLLEYNAREEVKIMDDHLDIGADEACASNDDALRFALPTEGSVKGSLCEAGVDSLLHDYAAV
jgi:hypothetical protein